VGTLKVVLYGYYKGILSSRMLAEACRRNVVFMALSADMRPHFTTLAGFVSSLDREIVGLFRNARVRLALGFGPSGELEHCLA
jgi:transposase